MDKKEKTVSSLWNTIKLIFADEGNSKEFEKELEEIQKVQKQVHAEREQFGASLRVNISGKAKQGKSIQKQPKTQEIERGE